MDELDKCLVKTRTTNNTVLDPHNKESQTITPKQIFTENILSENMPPVIG